MHLGSRLSNRQLLGFALCSHSRAPDSEWEHQRVGDRVGPISLSLSPAYSPVQRLDALCRTCPDDARLDWIYTLQLILQLQHTPLRSFHHKVVSVCQTRSFPFSCCGTDFLKCAPARLILSSSPIFQLLRFHELLGHPSRSSSPSSNFRSTHLGLRHQFSNFSNLMDLQLIRLSFTAGEHSYR